MITISQLTDNTQLEITYPQGDPNPTGDLVGRNVTFYPGKKIGPLMGVILEVMVMRSKTTEKINYEYVTI